MRLLSILVALAVLTPPAASQPYYRGEIEFTLDSSFSEAFPAQNALTLAGHLEAGYDLELSDLGFQDVSPVAFNLVLDPSVRVSQAVTTEPGLTELYAATTCGDLDLSAGVERLPLETARLSVPYSVETVGARGVRHGVPGLRGVLYSGDWRLRGAVLYSDVGEDFIENVTPLVSVRRSFDSFDLEAHVLYRNGLIAGLGGSGLISDVVVYGEAWLLTNPGFTDLFGRGALGLNGNLATGTWTLEGAYSSPATPEQGEAPAQLSPVTLLGQFALPLGVEGDANISLTGNASFNPNTPFNLNTTRSGVDVAYTILADAELTFGVGAGSGPEPGVSVFLNVREFF